MNNRKIGSRYEELAAEYLVNKGYEILERNFYTKRGELDIIAFDMAGDTLVFVEVKYRSSLKNGAPYEAVTPAKLYHITKSAEAYIVTHGGYGKKMRIDVISILKQHEGYEIKHLQNVTGF